MQPKTRVRLTRLLLTAMLGLQGCRGLPFGSDSDDETVPAREFGLNTVPRQWEPAFEDGDTTRTTQSGKQSSARLTDSAFWGDDDRAEKAHAAEPKSASYDED